MSDKLRNRVRNNEERLRELAEIKELNAQEIGKLLDQNHRDLDELDSRKERQHHGMPESSVSEEDWNYEFNGYMANEDVRI